MGKIRPNRTAPQRTPFTEQQHFQTHLHCYYQHIPLSMIQWKCVRLFLLLLLLFDHVLKKFLCANTFTDFIIIKRIDCLGSQCHFHENLATFRSPLRMCVRMRVWYGTLYKYIYTTHMANKKEQMSTERHKNVLILQF